MTTRIPHWVALPKLGALLLIVGCADDAELFDRDGGGDELADVGDAGGDASQPCGDPILRAAYAECSAAEDEQTCVARGGRWGTVGIFESQMCVCQTGEAECPCTKQSDCLAGCLAPRGPDDCVGVTEGLCAGGPRSGCWCVLQAGELAPSGICWD